MNDVGTSMLDPTERFRLFLRTEMGRRFGPNRLKGPLPTADDMGAQVKERGFTPACALQAVAVFCTHAEFRRFCMKHNVDADYLSTRQNALRDVRGQALAATSLAAPAVLAVLGNQRRTESPGWLDTLSTACECVEAIGNILSLFASIGG